MLKKVLLLAIFAVLGYGLWVSPSFKEVSAGVAIFLFGMLSLEEGFRSFTGGVLEKLLRVTTDRLWKSLAFGVVTTTLMQSSSLVSVITISFLSAGLLGLTQGIGVIFGANLGTTTGAWLVAGFGLKVDIAAYAMPMLVFGVLLLFQKSRNLKGVGYVLTGLGFLFLGIHHMKEGFEALRGSVDLTRFALPGYRGVALFTLVGIAATVIMQSSHATLVLTITALAAYQITYENALALAIGANVGTTVTAILGALGANEQGRRLAAAHLLFNVVTGALAVAFIQPFVWLTDRIGAGVGIAADDDMLKLALFHTLFNLLGLMVMLPFTGRLVAVLGRLIPAKAAERAEPMYLNRAAVDFPDTAVEAVRKEVIRVYEASVGIVARTLGLSREEVLGDADLPALISRRPGLTAYPVDEAYEKEVKAIFSAVIEFISHAAFTWQQEQSSRLHWLRNAGRRVVEAVKGAKHLEKNLVRHSGSPNPAVREEYQALRLRVAQGLRDLEEIRRGEASDLVIVSLDELKLNVEDLENTLLPRVYQLIHDGRITPAVGTSLMNDYGYACEILRDLVAAAGTLFGGVDRGEHAAQRTVVLDSGEIQEVLKVTAAHSAPTGGLAP